MGGTKHKELHCNTVDGTEKVRFPGAKRLLPLPFPILHPEVFSHHTLKNEWCDAALSVSIFVLGPIQAAHSQPLVLD